MADEPVTPEGTATPPTTPGTPAPEPVLEDPRPARPISQKERMPSMDALRGFAMLGILGPNILAFAWPWSVTGDADLMAELAIYVTPDVPVVHERANHLGIAIVEYLFMGKFMFLFATLFGAGVFFFDRKFNRAGERPGLARGAGLWYARIGWLTVFGLAHAFGMWFGDILVWYSLSALGYIWWIRRWRPRTLFVVGFVSYLLGMSVMLAMTVFGDFAVREGHITPEQMGGIDPFVEIGAYRDGTYLDAVILRIKTLVPWYFIMPFTFFWQVSGMMAVGLALAKTGVYTGQRSVRFYALLALVGIPLGLGISFLVHWVIMQSGSPIAFQYWMTVAQFFGAPLALGYAAVVVLLVKTGALRPVTVALAAVGRMALSNYLLQTIICTTVFYSHGFGMFAQVQYPALWGVVFGVWGVNILFSLVWLRFFRFGPAEWVWRSLTYLRPQPLLKRPDPPGASGRVTSG